MNVSCEIIRKKELDEVAMKVIKDFNKLKFNNKINNLDKIKYKAILDKYDSHFLSLAKGITISHNYISVKEALKYIYLLQHPEIETPSNILEKKAKKLVDILKKGNITYDFHDQLDQFYSMFDDWTNRKEKNKILKYFLKIKNLIKSLVFLEDQLSIKKTSIISQISDYITLMKKIDLPFTITILLQNYIIIKKTITGERYMWSLFNEYLIVDRDHSFGILLAVIRDYLLKITNNPFQKKKIYYMIDIDDYFRGTVKRKNNNKLLYNFFKIIGSLSIEEGIIRKEFVPHFDEYESQDETYIQFSKLLLDNILKMLPNNEDSSSSGSI